MAARCGGGTVGTMSLPPPAPAPAAGSPAPTGGNLVTSAWQALRHDKDLVLLPVVGGVAALVAIVPLLIVGFLIPDSASVARVLVGIIGVYVVAIVSTFFAVALAAGAHERMNGRDPSIKSAVATAWSRKRTVVGWALLSATVGIVLRALEERLKGVGGALVGLLGNLAWSVASFFAIPIIAANDIGAIDALKLSTATFKQRWSSAARVTLRLGLYAVGLMVGLFVAIFAVAALASVSTVLAVVVGIVLFMAWLTALLLLSAVSSYARVALYRYASGLPTPGFAPAMLAAAVTEKR